MRSSLTRWPSAHRLGRRYARLTRAEPLHIPRLFVSGRNPSSLFVFDPFIRSTRLTDDPSSQHKSKKWTSIPSLNTMLIRDMSLPRCSRISNKHPTISRASRLSESSFPLMRALRTRCICHRMGAAFPLHMIPHHIRYDLWLTLYPTDSTLPSGSPERSVPENLEMHIQLLLYVFTRSLRLPFYVRD